MKKLILTDDDFYNGPNGKEIRGGTRRLRRLHEHDLIIHVKNSGDFEVLKDREARSQEEIKDILDFDERIILAIN